MTSSQNIEAQNAPQGMLVFYEIGVMPDDAPQLEDLLGQFAQEHSGIVVRSISDNSDKTPEVDSVNTVENAVSKKWNPDLVSFITEPGKDLPTAIISEVAVRSFTTDDKQQLATTRIVNIIFNAPYGWRRARSGWDIDGEYAEKFIATTTVLASSGSHYNTTMHGLRADNLGLLIDDIENGSLVLRKLGTSGIALLKEINKKLILPEEA